MTDELATFLLARIAEDEQSARSAESMAEEIDLPRELAKCQAGRQIVEQCTDALREADTMPYGGGAMFGREVLKLLALPYRDHPDYRTEWAPESDT